MHNATKQPLSVRSMPSVHVVPAECLVTVTANLSSKSTRKPALSMVHPRPEPQPLAAGYVAVLRNNAQNR